LQIYAGLGLLLAFVFQIKDSPRHIDEWKHSSIDFEEDPETPSFWLKKCLNKVLSTIFTPAFLQYSGP